MASSTVFPWTFPAEFGRITRTISFQYDVNSGPTSVSGKIRQKYDILGTGGTCTTFPWTFPAEFCGVQARLRLKYDVTEAISSVSGTTRHKYDIYHEVSSNTRHLYNVAEALVSGNLRLRYTVQQLSVSWGAGNQIRRHPIS